MPDNKESLEAHLRSGRFVAGVARGRWKLLDVDWPFALISVTAKDGRRFTLRFDCSGYPAQAPTATLWDCIKQQMLAPEHWPRGGRVSQVFNPNWKGGAALYLPCDRESIQGHANWLSEHPWLIWNPARGLLQYVEAVCEFLHSSELVYAAA